MFDSKKFGDLFLPDQASIAEQLEIQKKNLNKIRRNNCGSGAKSDLSGMSEDLFDVSETSCLDSTSPNTNKTLEKLREKENQLLDEKVKSESNFVAQKQTVKNQLKELENDIKCTKTLIDQRRHKKRELENGIASITKETSEIQDKYYNSEMAWTTENLFKVDENLRCTDETFCKACHKDPGKCFRIRSLSSTVHLPN